MNSDPFDNNVNPFLSQSDKGSDSIVVQLGSHSIKFGLASQYYPFLIPNVIAHRIKPNPPKENNDTKDKESMDIIVEEDDEISEAFLSRE